MLQNRRGFFTLMITAVAATVILGAIFLWATVCNSTMELANGMQAPMRCSYMAKTCALMACLLLVVITEALVRKQNIGGNLIAFGALFLLLPSRFGIGICQGAEMACHTTALWIRIAACIILLSGLVNLVSEKTNVID